MTDDELEQRIREELFHGCVQSAKDYVCGIVNEEKRKQMKELIHEYTGFEP